MQGTLGTDGVSDLYVGEGHVFPVFAEGCVLVDRYDLGLLVAGSLDGDLELMDGSYFPHHPAFAEGGTGIADLLSVDVDYKNGPYGFGFGVHDSAGHQHVSHVYFGGLDRLAIFHE